MLTRDCSIFCTYRVFRGAEAPAKTDHRLAVGTVKLQPYLKPPKPTTKRLNVRSFIENSSIATNYNKFEALSALGEDLESSWSTIHSVILSAASETIGLIRHQMRPWLSSGTLDILDEKRKALLCGDTHETRRLKGVLKLYGKLADTAEEWLRRNDLRPTFKAIKSLRCPP